MCEFATLNIFHSRIERKSQNLNILYDPEIWPKNPASRQSKHLVHFKVFHFSLDLFKTPNFQRKSRFRAKIEGFHSKNGKTRDVSTFARFFSPDFFTPEWKRSLKSILSQRKFWCWETGCSPCNEKRFMEKISWPKPVTSSTSLKGRLIQDLRAFIIVVIFQQLFLRQKASLCWKRWQNRVSFDKSPDSKKPKHRQKLSKSFVATCSKQNKFWFYDSNRLFIGTRKLLRLKEQRQHFDWPKPTKRLGFFIHVWWKLPLFSLDSGLYNFSKLKIFVGRGSQHPPTSAACGAISNQFRSVSKQFVSERGESAVRPGPHVLCRGNPDLAIQMGNKVQFFNWEGTEALGQLAKGRGRFSGFNSRRAVYLKDLPRNRRREAPGLHQAGVRSQRSSNLGLSLPLRGLEIKLQKSRCWINGWKSTERS